MPKVERPRPTALLTFALAVIVFGTVCAVTIYFVVSSWSLGGID